MSAWDVLLGDDEEHREVEQQITQAWERLQARAFAKGERIERAWSEIPLAERDLLSRVWMLRHTLENRVVVGASPLGLVLCAATTGSDQERERASWLAARSARALSRTRARAAMGDGWVAVALPDRSRVVAADTGEEMAFSLAALHALVVASRLDEGSARHA